jgi:hypothetical protein
MTKSTIGVVTALLLSIGPRAHVVFAGSQGDFGAACRGDSECKSLLCQEALNDKRVCVTSCSDGRSCPELSFCRNGRCLPYSLVESAADRAACEHGDGAACLKLAHLHEGNDDDDKLDDPAGAAALYDKACAARNREACAALGHKLLQSDDVGDRPRGLAALDRACDLGDWFECESAAEVRDSDPWLADAKRAAAMRRRVCDRATGPTQATGCFNLASAYKSGVGVAKNEKQARALYQRACMLQHYEPFCSEPGRASPRK